MGLATEGNIAALRFTITRITDFAMRAGIGDRVVKDWRRFYADLTRCEPWATPGSSSC